MEYAFGLTADYAYSPLVLEAARPADSAEVDELTPVEHALLVHVGGALAPIWWLNLELGMPYALFETGEDGLTPDGPAPKGHAGIGDLRFGVHFRPVATEAFDLSLGARVWMPNGTGAAYLRGQQRYRRMEVVTAMAGEHDIVMYGCTMGLAPLFFAGRSGDRLALSCAAHLRITPTFSLGLEPHIAVFVFPPADEAPSQAPGLSEGSQFDSQLEPLLAGRLHFGELGLGFAGGPGLGGAPGTAAARGLVTLSYRAKADRVEDESEGGDTDLDGIPDAYDACPDEAGPGLRRGCPLEGDMDGDGLVRGDACPKEPGARYDDPLANGCPDRDNDHVADPIDDCPIEPGAHWNGCPTHARLVGLGGTGPLKFEVTPPVRFSRRSAKLSDMEIAAFKEIVTTLLANPKLQMLSVTIGAKGAPMKLTDARAKAVLDLLRDQNLESHRYEVVLGSGLAAGRVDIRVIR